MPSESRAAANAAIVGRNGGARGQRFAASRPTRAIAGLEAMAAVRELARIAREWPVARLDRH
jgi:hypothetical protein